MIDLIQIEKDWQRKLKDRRKEVRSIRRVQMKEKEREQKRWKKKIEREAIEKEEQSRKEIERKALEEEVRSMAPKIEWMETKWNRLCSASRASCIDKIIAFWEGIVLTHNRLDREVVVSGLKEKEKTMKELVAAKEDEEKQARAELSELETLKTKLLEMQRSPKSHSSKSTISETAPLSESTESVFVETNPQQTEMIRVRIEQGFRPLIDELGDVLGMDDSIDDPKDETSSLSTLFKKLTRQLILFQQRRQSQTNVDHKSSFRKGSMMLSVVLDDVSTQPLLRQQSYASFLKELENNKNTRDRFDVTKLVGYVDEDAEPLQLKRRGSADPREKDGIIERSFLKARSIRYALRAIRNKER